MPKELKRLMADELKAELDASPNLMVVRLNPMTAETNYALRTTLREQGAHLRVIHNRTTRFSLDDARKPLGEYFSGQTALTLLPGEDPDFVSIAKALMDAQKAKSIEVRGAFVDGEVLDGAGVDLLSKSPDKPTLRGMLAGAILGPARGIAVALNAVGGGLARCLQARIEQQEGNES
jgi:large subunit ribosomal protein L10